MVELVGTRLSFTSHLTTSALSSSQGVMAPCCSHVVVNNVGPLEARLTSLKYNPCDLHMKMVLGQPSAMKIGSCLQC